MATASELSLKQIADAVADYLKTVSKRYLTTNTISFTWQSVALHCYQTTDIILSQLDHDMGLRLIGFHSANGIDIEVIRMEEDVILKIILPTCSMPDLIRTHVEPVATKSELENAGLSLKHNPVNVAIREARTLAFAHVISMFGLEITRKRARSSKFFLDYKVIRSRSAGFEMVDEIDHPLYELIAAHFREIGIVIEDLVFDGVTSKTLFSVSIEK